MPKGQWDETKVRRDPSGRFVSSVKITHGVEQRLRTSSSTRTGRRPRSSTRRIGEPVESRKLVIRNGKIVR